MSSLWKILTNSSTSLKVSILTNKNYQSGKKNWINSRKFSCSTYWDLTKQYLLWKIGLVNRWDINSYHLQLVIFLMSSTNQLLKILSCWVLLMVQIPFLLFRNLLKKNTWNMISLKFQWDKEKKFLQKRSSTMLLTMEVGLWFKIYTIAQAGWHHLKKYWITYKSLKM